MTIKAIGRSALLLAAGLFVCFAGPSPAAAGAEDAAAATKPETAGAPVALHKYARHGSRHGKKYAHRDSGKVAPKASTGDKTADAADDGDHSSADPAIGGQRQCPTDSCPADIGRQPDRQCRQGDDRPGQRYSAGRAGQAG